MVPPLLRTAVFCHDTWHPAALIQQGLAPHARDEFRFEWLSTPEQWTTAQLSAYDLVVLAKGDTTGPDDRSPWLTPAIEQAFVDHVRSGKGFFALHGGLCYRQSPQLRALTGGAFLRHPPPCPVTLEPGATHPLAASIPASTHHDEHYEIVLDDPDADIFLRTRSEHGLQPAGWTRVENGRVCALTPGHTEEAWQNPCFHQLLDRCLRWIARRETTS